MVITREWWEGYLNFRLWMIGIVGFPLLWLLCLEEIRYWIWGEHTVAAVQQREEYDGDPSARTRMIVNLTVSYVDEANGQERMEMIVYSKPTLDDPEIKEVKVEYLPSVEGMVRLETVMGRYFAVIFLGGQAMFVAILLWGWSLARADTWAWE